MIVIFFDNQGETQVVAVDSNSLIKDVLLDFLKRNNYYENLDPNLYVFKSNGKVLNIPRFLEKRVRDLLTSGMKITFNNKQIPYSGGEHICPYGCGRYIPDEYKGCTELLAARPNYFD